MAAVHAESRSIVEGANNGSVAVAGYHRVGTRLSRDVIQACAHTAARVGDFVTWIDEHRELTLGGVGPRGDTLRVDVTSTSFNAQLDLLERADACELLLKEYASRLPPRVVTIDEKSLGRPLSFTSIDVHVTPVGYRSWPLRFDVAPRQVIDMVSSAGFYKRGDTPIREMLQNAVDACRYRVARERSTEYRPKITVELARGGRALVISDNGVGMSEAVIREYFGKVGRSFYRDNLTELRRLGFEPIGNFGIGVLAAFALCRSLTLTTHDGTTGHRVSISDVQSYFAVEPVHREELGTDVRLELDEPLGFDVLASCRHYARLVEIPIEVIVEGRSTTIPPRWYESAGWLAIADSAAASDQRPLRGQWSEYRDDVVAFRGQATSAHAIAQVEVVFPNPLRSAHWADLPRPHACIAVCNHGVLIELSATLGLEHRRESSDRKMFWYGVYGSVDLTTHPASLGPSREFLGSDEEQRSLGDLVTQAVFDGLASALHHYSCEPLARLAFRRLVFDLLVAGTGSGLPGRAQDLADGDIAPYGEYNLRYSDDPYFTRAAATLYGEYYPLAFVGDNGEPEFKRLGDVMHSSETIEVVRADLAFWRAELRRGFRRSTALAVVDSMREVGLIIDFCKDQRRVAFLRAHECIQRCGVPTRQLVDPSLPGPTRFVTLAQWVDSARALIVIDEQLAHGYVMFRGVHTVEPGSPLFAFNLSHEFGKWLAANVSDEIVRDLLSLLLTSEMDPRWGSEAPTLKLVLLRLLASESSRQLPSWPTRVFAKSVDLGRVGRSKVDWPRVQLDGSLLQHDGVGSALREREMFAWWATPLAPEPRRRRRSSSLRLPKRR